MNTRSLNGGGLGGGISSSNGNSVAKLEEEVLQEYRIALDNLSKVRIAIHIYIYIYIYIYICILESSK